MTDEPKTQVECPECEGHGIVDYLGYLELRVARIVCATCHGTGKVDEEAKDE